MKSMMCPVKRTGYINIYDNNRVCKQIFETEKKAKIAGIAPPTNTFKQSKSSGKNKQVKD